MSVKLLLNSWTGFGMIYFFVVEESDSLKRGEYSFTNDYF